MNFEIDPKIPIYVQIIQYIKKKIILAEIKGGERLPSVRDFAIEFKVNPNTIQRVYTELENEKLIFTQRGIGKFVTEESDVVTKLKKDMFNEIIDNFIRDSKELGFSKDEIVTIISERFQEV
jgi:DNA-binding transcriptional regulator YhcF (GntR family)